MKTADEILKELCRIGAFSKVDDELSRISGDDILEAMEKYADQYKPSKHLLKEILDFINNTESTIESEFGEGYCVELKAKIIESLRS